MILYCYNITYKKQQLEDTSLDDSREYLSSTLIVDQGLYNAFKPLSVCIEYYCCNMSFGL